MIKSVPLLVFSGLRQYIGSWEIRYESHFGHLLEYPLGTDNTLIRATGITR